MQWIWQDSQWPEFRWDSASLQALLAKIHQKQGELIGMLNVLGMRVGLETALSAMSEELLRSSEIEGVLLNPDQVRSSVAMRLGLAHEGLPTPSHYIDGLVDVMVDACRQAKQPLNHEKLFEWHRALFPAGGKNVGCYRTGDAPMRVISGIIGKEQVHFEAPPSRSVPQMMDDFLKWINGDHPIDPIIQSAIGALWFVTIHPFADGNGRLSRTITDMLLARADNMPQRYYSMTAAIEQNRSEYYQILEITQHGNMDITPWLTWFLHCLEKALDHAKIEIQEAVETARFWEKYSDVPFNERQRRVLTRFIAHFEGKLTSSKYAKLAKCSQDTALRDIQELTAHGILAIAGYGRGTHYVLK